MKKNLIIGILATIAILSISFGYYQKGRADEYKLKAAENELMAIEMKALVEKQIKMAQQQSEIAKMKAIVAYDLRMNAEEELQKRTGTK